MIPNIQPSNFNSGRHWSYFSRARSIASCTRSSASCTLRAMVRAKRRSRGSSSTIRLRTCSAAATLGTWSTHIYGCAQPFSSLLLLARRGRLRRCVSYSLRRMSGSAMKCAQLLSLCLMLGCTGSAVGQILPPVQLPNVPILPTDELNRTVNGVVRTADPQQLRELRRLRVRELLRTNRVGLEADPRGAAILRSEVVALSPSAEALERARAEGFNVGRTRALEGLDATIVVLEAPAGMSTRRALQRLRQLDPGGVYDFNHVYLDSGAVAEGVAEAPATSASRPGPARERCARRADRWRRSAQSSGLSRRIDSRARLRRRRRTERARHRSRIAPGRACRPFQRRSGRRGAFFR